MSDYQIMRAADAPDYTGGDASPFLGYGRPLGSEQLAVNLRVLAPGATHMPPGWDPAKGHSHNTIEEIYFVIEGEITVKAGDDEHTLGARDAILLPPGTVRGARNLTDQQAAMVMISRTVEDQSTESNQHEDFWPTG